MIILGKFKADLTNWYNNLGDYEGAMHETVELPLQMFYSPVIIEELVLSIKNEPLEIESGMLYLEESDADWWHVFRLENKDNEGTQFFRVNSMEGVWLDPFTVDR